MKARQATQEDPVKSRKEYVDHTSKHPARKDPKMIRTFDDSSGLSLSEKEARGIPRTEDWLSLPTCPCVSLKAFTMLQFTFIFLKRMA